MTETEGRYSLRSLAATLALVWVGFAFYGVLNQLSGMVTLNDFEPHLGRFLIDMTLLYWLPWILFAPVLAAASKRIPIRPDNWVRSLPVHAALLMAIALAHGLGVGYLYYYSGGASGSMAQYAAWQHAGHYLFGDGMLLFDVVAYAVFAASLNIRHFHHVVRQQQLDASELKHRLAEQRLQTLRMQINPHFLFNALNAISVLVKKGDNERAGDMIKLLSSFFRRIAAQVLGVFRPPPSDDEPLVATYGSPPASRQSRAPADEPPAVDAAPIAPGAAPAVEAPVQAATPVTPTAATPAPAASAPPPEREFGAEPKHTITALKLVPWGEAIEILAEAQGMPQYRSFWLSNPERLVIDIEDAELHVSSAELSRNSPHPLIRQLRAAQNSFEPPLVRLVVEAERDGPVEINATAAGISVKLSPAP